MRRALAFLTPLGGAAAPSPDALRWFPAVGAVVGAGLGGFWWGARHLWPPGVTAALVVAADLAVTGLLHLDGLVDAADGLLPPLGRGRRLEVMADPAAGAFGVGAAGVVMLVRWAALSALAPSVLLMAALWCMSRSAMAVTVAEVPYARETGLATAFRGGSGGAWYGVAGIGLALLLAVAGRGAAGGAAVIAGVAAAAGVVGLARARLGGFTGDVLGAAGIVGETVGLVVAAGRW